ncbi:MAG: ABC transporter, partial [Woeseia sp.]|nr:ABC transporter [Woeseia sp.]NNL55704.1 ABC transporter [Woeseia sp.]
MLSHKLRPLGAMAILLLSGSAMLGSGTAWAALDADLLAGLKARNIGPATVSGRIA